MGVNFYQEISESYSLGLDSLLCQLSGSKKVMEKLVITQITLKSVLPQEPFY